MILNVVLMVFFYFYANFVKTKNNNLPANNTEMYEEFVININNV